MGVFRPKDRNRKGRAEIPAKSVMERRLQNDEKAQADLLEREVAKPIEDELKRPLIAVPAIFGRQVTSLIFDELAPHRAPSGWETFVAPVVASGTWADVTSDGTFSVAPGAHMLGTFDPTRMTGTATVDPSMIASPPSDPGSFAGHGGGHSLGSYGAAWLGGRRGSWLPSPPEEFMDPYRYHGGIEPVELKPRESQEAPAAPGTTRDTPEAVNDDVGSW